MIARRISGAAWPALATSTPELQSSQRLPYLSYTKMSSARSHTSGGWPRIETGSHRRSFSSTGTESGCGSGVTMRRYCVSTRGTFFGVMSNSLPISDRFLVNSHERSRNSFAAADRINDGDAIRAKTRRHRRAKARFAGI